MKVQIPASTAVPNFLIADSLSQNRRNVSLEPLIKVSLSRSNEVCIFNVCGYIIEDVTTVTIFAAFKPKCIEEIFVFSCICLINSEPIRR